MLRTACPLVFVCALAAAAPVFAQEQGSADLATAAADLPPEGGSHATAITDPALVGDPTLLASAGSTAVTSAPIGVTSAPIDVTSAPIDVTSAPSPVVASAPSPDVASAVSPVVASAPTPVVALAPTPVVASNPTPVASAFRRKEHRPAALLPLYASFAMLQALDYASTARALSTGAGTEANPVMRSIVGNRAAFIAVKAGAAAGIVLAGEKMWKRNRVAAVIFVAAANGAVAAIVARNYSVR
jgi:uncharacterized protein DUF5658